MACASSIVSAFLQHVPLLTSTVRVRSMSMCVSTTCTSTEPAATNSLYQVLGKPRGATYHEIKAAYRRLVWIWHPNVVASDQRDTSADEFMKLHAAYSTLFEPEFVFAMGSASWETEAAAKQVPCRRWAMQNRRESDSNRYLYAN